jgi:hypothetical protein
LPKKPKPLWESDIACAWCNKPNHIRVDRKVITPAEPAQVELEVLVERSTQATLDQEPENE